MLLGPFGGQRQRVTTDPSLLNEDDYARHPTVPAKATGPEELAVALGQRTPLSTRSVGMLQASR